MRKWLGILISLTFALIIVVVAVYFPLWKEKTQFEPQHVTFPFSWEEKGYPEDYTLFDSVKQLTIRITVVNITAFGKTFGGLKADEGYQFYAVYVTYKNLGHQKYSRPSGYDVGVSLELVTNRSNIYKPKNGFFAGTVNELKPEEEEDEWIKFEIRVDEKPVELRDYETVDDELIIAYIWKIE